MDNLTVSTRLVVAGQHQFEVLECGSGDKFAMLLHGFPLGAYSWRRTMHSLAALGYTVWAPSLRGYGGSSRPTLLRDYRTRVLIDDVAALIDCAAAESTLLVGSDWGGHLAWNLALSGMRRLEGLVTLNSPHPWAMARDLRRMPQRARSWYFDLYRLPGLPERVLLSGDAGPLGWVLRKTSPLLPNEVIDECRRSAMEPGAMTAMLNYYRARDLDPEADELEWLTRFLHLPTLMVWGEEDPVLRKELTYPTWNRVSPLAIRYLPGVSHFPHLEAPRLFENVLGEWLGQAMPVPEDGA